MRNASLEPVAVWTAGSREGRLRRLGPSRGFSVPLVRQSWPTVATRLLAGVAGIGAGVFLLSQLSASAGSDKRILFCGLGLAIAGVACLARTLVPLVGTLSVDSQGVRLHPWPLGFDFPWEDLASWQANPAMRSDSSFPAVEFRLHDVRGLYELPLAVISERDLAELIRTLRSLAPELERKPLGGDDPLGYSRFRRKVNPV